MRAIVAPLRLGARRLELVGQPEPASSARRQASWPAARLLWSLDFILFLRFIRRRCRRQLKSLLPFGRKYCCATARPVFSSLCIGGKLSWQDLELAKRVK